MQTYFQSKTAARWLMLAAVAGLASAASAADKDEAAKPPAAEAAMIRRIRNLPGLADESRARLVVTAGKTVETDGVNRVFLTGSIKSGMREGKVVYVVRTGPVGSTLMRVPPGHPKGRQFVSVSTDLLPYDSKQPLLIDAPAELKLSYQVWNASGTEVFDPAAEEAAIQQTGNNMKAYKPAEPGMVRHVIALAKLADENSAKVEIIAGKTLAITGKADCSFDGEVKESTIMGWGFTRFDVTLGELNGAKPDPQGGTPKFVAIGGAPKFFRYNSRLPLVVYAPEGVEIRHRVWQPGAKVEVDQDA